MYQLKALIALVVLVLVGTSAWLAFDELRLTAIKTGMSEVDALGALGKPTVEFPSPIPAYLLADECQNPGFAKCAIYKRRFRTSMFVFYDSTGRIACVQRAFFRSGGVW